ncbi:MAG: YwaF family protein [Clostridia bacterium]|nr:YwaF family protein [Clostridia bacterium]
MLWGSYGLVHIITLIISACMILGIYFILRNRSEKTKVIVLFILSLSGLAAIIFNLVTWGTPLEYLPFHMCSITALILPIAILTRSKIFSNLLLFWCLGAAMAIICNQGQANYVIPSATFFFYYIPHTLEFGIPILMFALKIVKKDVRCIASTVVLTMAIYTVVHFINLALNSYCVANAVTNPSGEIVQVNYMYSLFAPVPLMQAMYNLIPHSYWYMYVVVPFVVIYLGIVYLPEIIALIKSRKKAQ